MTATATATISIIVMILLSTFMLATTSVSTATEVNLLLPVGAEIGLNGTSSSLPQETLAQIIDGVSRKNKDALYYYGLLRLYGISFSVSLPIAQQHFLEAATLGHVPAMTAVSVLILSTRGHETSDDDLKLAELWLTRAEALGSTDAHWLLAKLYLEDPRRKSEWYLQQAVKHLSIAVQHDIAPALHLWGVLHEYGHGVPRDFIVASDSYTRAAEAGHSESLVHLSLMLVAGRAVAVNGAAVNEARAASLMTTAAVNHRHPTAAYYMGVFYFNGYGVTRNYKEALRWFEQAASMLAPPPTSTSTSSSTSSSLMSTLHEAALFEKATLAATELKALLTEAQQRNERVVDAFARMSSSPDEQ